MRLLHAKEMPLCQCHRWRQSRHDQQGVELHHGGCHPQHRRWPAVRRPHSTHIRHSLHLVQSKGSRRCARDHAANLA